MPSPILTAAAVLTATAGTLTYAALSAESQLFGPTLIAPPNPMRSPSPTTTAPTPPPPPTSLKSWPATRSTQPSS